MLILLHYVNARGLLKMLAIGEETDLVLKLCANIHEVLSSARASTASIMHNDFFNSYTVEIHSTV